VLDQVAEHLKATPLAKVRIIGHTDDVGEAPFNEKLSLDRATAVKALLESRGIAPDRLSAEGGGKGAPIATNTTEDGRARNRRVEFVAVP
jgi:outer membrane protein OmpA-like peptidoglycan-associated protein